jgi:hypothetical protein
MKTSISTLCLAAALSGTAALGGVYSFDVPPSVGNAGLANAYANDGTTFSYAVYAPKVDSFGSDIPGTDFWQIDLTAPAVTVEKPQDYGRSATGEKAMNALFQPILVLLPGSSTATSFSGKLELSSISGNVNPVQSVLFFNAQDQQIGSLSVDLSIGGGTFSIGSLSGVSKVLLPAGKFYQQISFTPSAAVPEVDARCLVAGALLVGAVAWRRTRR